MSEHFCPWWIIAILVIVAVIVVAWLAVFCVTHVPSPVVLP